MVAYIGLLRAVNVGGRNKVAMADLREVLVGLGMRDVRSVLQSGNLVFESQIDAEPLERMFEEAAERQLALKTDFLLRRSHDWKRIIAENPFRNEAQRDPGHLLVMFFKRAPSRTKVTALQKAVRGREIMQPEGREIYIVYPDGIGRSRLTTELIEEKVGMSTTGRNWNTVMRLDAMASGS